MSIIEHIILFLLLFGVYAFWGKYLINKSGLKFWQAAIFPILLYVFITGSRYGWGNDYLWYRAQFENIELIDEQVAFKWLVQFLNFLGFNYVGAFMLYSFIFIVCAFILLRSYGEQSLFMYCFLIPATMYTTCHTIRQGLGMSFILLALVFFYQRKWLYMALVVVIAYYFHSATIITLASMLGIFYIFKKPIPFLITIPLYLYFTFAFDVGKMAFLADFLSEHISLDNKFQSYIDRSEVWFGTDAVREGFEQGAFAQIMSSLYTISLFYLGYKTLQIRENKLILYMYNTVVLGTIMARAVYLFEILRRFTSPMVMFYFIPLGYIFYIYSQECKKPENIRVKKYFNVGIIFILSFLLMYWGRWIFLNENGDFFWNNLDADFNINLFIHD